MVNRIGGLASGMDIDALVAKLMAAERTPLTKLQQKKQTSEWTRDAYRSINAKLKTFDTYIADNLLIKGFNTKTATSSNSKYVTATATSSASGNLTIEGVSQLATAGKTVGSKQVNSNAGVATGSTKISDIEGSTFTGTGEYSILLKAIKSDGTLASEATEVKFKATDTIDDVMKKINSSNAGVTAFFENGKLSVAAKNTGELAGNAAEVQLVTEQTKNGVKVEGTGNALFSVLGVGSPGSTDLVDGGSNAIFRVNGIDTERSTNTFTMGGYNITLNETFNSKATIETRIKTLEELLAATKLAIPDLETKISTLTGEAATAKDLYDDALKIFNGANTSSALSAAGKKVLATMNKEQLATLDNLDLTDNAAIEASDLTDAQKKALKALKTEEKEALNSSLTNELNDLQRFSAYENLSTTSKNIFMNMDPADIEKLANISDLTSNDEIESSDLTDDQKKALKSLSSEQRQILCNISSEDLKGMQEVINTKNAYDIKNTELTTKIQQLETAKSNEIKYTKDLADAKNALANTPADGTTVPNVTLSSTTDVDDMMKKIKEFVTMYNGLVKEMNDQTKEKKYRDYSPLTDEQRKEMSENEIKLWEEKAKSGLLRSDSILRSGLAGMRGLIYESNPAVSNPKYNTLFNIGITSSKSYNDGGTLEIDEDKLRKALEDDPDAVTTLFTNKGDKQDTISVDGVEKTVDTRGFLLKLRGSMDKFKLDIEKKAGNASSVDNSYSIGKSLVDMDKRIDTWKDKLEKIEARYWKQFSAMEKAINKANSQSSYFAQFSGQA